MNKMLFFLRLAAYVGVIFKYVLQWRDGIRDCLLSFVVFLMYRVINLLATVPAMRFLGLKKIFFTNSFKILSVYVCILRINGKIF